MNSIRLFDSVDVLVGDCVESMKSIQDKSVNTCITSPPYFGLRDYGVDGQIGLEETPEAYVQRLVEVFREVRRVLRDDGTLWLNLGDSYAGSGRGPTGENGLGNQQKRQGFDSPKIVIPDGLKPKDLIGIPWRVAFALQADGWYLRQDIIWHKTNPMPESVTDRCTKAHEYIFLLSKSQKYYYDYEAVKEETGREGGKPRVFGAKEQEGTMRNDVGMRFVDDGTRNKRSVWTVSTKPTTIAHFATFPPDLIEPCVLAGCPVGGTVLDPFGGSGTTGGVAMRNGRKSILCELNPKYVGIMEQRISEVINERRMDEPNLSQMDLFGDTI